jgi:hypothetical protein
MISRMHKLTIAITAFLLAVWSVPCHAVESTFKEIFTDSFYGGLTGTLVGAAVMAFAKKPVDHLDSMGYGAAVGILAGAAFGVGKALVEIDNGKVKFSMPTFTPDFQEKNNNGKMPVLITAELLRGKF